ncbi:MAG: DUF2764 domain-containing protein [Bacteroidales bacterium]|jgi:hypothetical protein|nr:DUF2764 domain-containing protein [Bacteroidales bacterium]
MNYYCLIAGLPDIEIEDHKLVFSVADFKEEVRPQLSNEDAKLFDLFFIKFDNKNLLRYLKNKEAIFDEHGNLSKEELENCLQLLKEDSKTISPFFPSYFETFVLEYKEAQQTDMNTAFWEDRLTELYYQWAINCGNKLISCWFEFNLNLNNILAAYACRKYQKEAEPVGDNEVAESIKKSSQRDFGLTGTLDYLDVLQRLSEESDLFEREKKIDLLKWQWLDEQTFFNYFSIEKVFAYLVKLEIIERWASLDPIEGEKLFRILIGNLKENAMKRQADGGSGPAAG